MEITGYQSRYRQQIIDLILHIQNDEAGIGLPIEEQPDLLDIPFYYQKNGGGFWLAVEMCIRDRSSSAAMQCKLIFHVTSNRQPSD